MACAEVFGTHKRRCAYQSKLVIQEASSPPQLLPHHLGAFYHRPHFSERNIAREILQTAIGSHDDALDRHIGQRSPDASSDCLGRLDGYIRKVESTEDDCLSRQFFQN